VNSKPFNPSNRFGLNYFEESKKFKQLPFPIIDSHAHINGREAVKIYKKAAEIYGVNLTYSMTRYEQIDDAREIMGDKIRFITMPAFTEEEKYYEDVSGYMKYIEKFYAKGSRILKFWAAPRGRDIGLNLNKPDLLTFDSPRRQEIMLEASKMKMVFMVHISDPDTWFQTKYKDSKKYGRKIDQYKPFEEALSKYTNSFIAAHMGGWPEDLEFLSGLLSRHSNLYLDSSATKWVVRELSKHNREEILDFLNKWKDRILFGSDIVTNETHVDSTLDANNSFDLAELYERAFDLYASRYFALRTLFETDYQGESPIADPDLAMVSPDKFDEKDAPVLSGKSLPLDILQNLYFESSNKLLEPYHTLVHGI
jgi:hypothetical protein